MDKKEIVIVSWNVNSIRARIVDNMTGTCKLKSRPVNNDSPLGELIKKEQPDIICFQETKCTENTKNCIESNYPYNYWNCSSLKKGYSGVSIWSKKEPEKITSTLPGLNTRSKHLLKEGRILTAYYKTFILVTTYTPNTLRAGTKRVDGTYPKPEFMQSRTDWDSAMLKYLKKLKKTEKSIVWCGDFNVARNSMDLYKGDMTKDKLLEYGSVKESVFTPNNGLLSSQKAAADALYKRYIQGFLSSQKGGGAGYRLEERRDIEKILKNGFVDVFREKHPKKYGFTYWDMIRPSFRSVNYGLRLDYFVVNKKLLEKVKSITVLKDLGYNRKTRKVASDHAPVVLKLNISI